MHDQQIQNLHDLCAIATNAAFHLIVCSNSHSCCSVADFTREDFSECVFLGNEPCERSSFVLDVLMGLGGMRNARVCCKSGCDDCLRTLQSRTYMNILAVRIPEAYERLLQDHVLSITKTETKWMFVSLSNGGTSGFILPSHEHGLVHLQQSYHRESGVHLTTLERTDFCFCEMMHSTLSNHEKWEAYLSQPIRIEKYPNL